MTGGYRRRWSRGASARAAWRAWTRGDIGDVERLAEHTTPRQRAHLLFLTGFVRGRYEEALAEHARIRAGHIGINGLDQSVAQAWLHLGQPREAQAHLQRRPGRRPPPDLLLRVERPLQATLGRTTALPFVAHPLAPYLPAVEATLDGRALNVHIDTGGAFVVMGTQRAEALGIALVAKGRAHHGVTRTDSFAGTARELTLGAATLTNVPVEAMPTLRDGQDVVLIGTNILQQFLATINYPGQRLLLSPRRDPRQAAEHLALLDDQPQVARMPFFLWADHYMFARGGLGTRQDLNLFIDSGLVYVIQEDDSPPRQACLCATARSYCSWGVPRARAAGPHFAIDQPICLGPLSQDNQFVATAPTRRPPWASFGGVRIDGLLSHAFLDRYAWTLDFDQHEYTFRQPPAPG
jgi:Aspartyl protease